MGDSHDYTATLRIQRPSKVAIDERGHTVWVAPVDDLELELMSSQELRLALAAADTDERASMEALVSQERDGIVIRDRATGVFDVVSEAQLQELLKGSGVSLMPDIDTVTECDADSACETLTLVTTQALRAILDPDSDEARLTPGADRNRGFNPYDKS